MATAAEHLQAAAAMVDLWSASPAELGGTTPSSWLAAGLIHAVLAVAVELGVPGGPAAVVMPPLSAAPPAGTAADTTSG